MRSGRSAIFVVGLALSLLVSGFGASGTFVIFPKAGSLLSPDGRYEVRDADRVGSSSEFTGSFHSLWLVELPTGRSRKLCDYLGSAAVAWSGDDGLLITEYVSRKMSRAWLFMPVTTEQPLLIDIAALLRMIPPTFRESLRGKDHVFVEANRVEGNSFYLRVWGYGQHDPHGFRWGCQYGVSDEKMGCEVVK